VEVRSVGNSQVLKETALVEAFNLKAAVEIVMKNNTAAAEALADMPPRWGDAAALWSPLSYCTK
jgi:tetratricopeptide repeat protein 30